MHAEDAYEPRVPNLTNPPLLDRGPATTTTRQVAPDFDWLQVDPAHLPICLGAKRTGRRCRSWRCPACCVYRGHQEAHAVLAGLRWASRHGLRARWITLTDPSKGRPMHLSVFNEAFRQFT